MIRMLTLSLLNILDILINNNKGTDLVKRYCHSINSISQGKKLYQKFWKGCLNSFKTDSLNYSATYVIRFFIQWDLSI